MRNRAIEVLLLIARTLAPKDSDTHACLDITLLDVLYWHGRGPKEPGAPHWLDGICGVLWIAAMIAVPALVVLGIAWQVSK